MLLNESNENAPINWFAVFSYSASVGISLAVWSGLIRAVQHLLR